MPQSPNLGMTYLEDAQSQKEVSINDALDVVDKFASVETITTTGGTYTLSASEAQSAVIQVEGVLGSNSTIVLPDTLGDKLWIINNATSGAFTVQAKVGTGGTLRTVTSGSMILIWDGGYTTISAGGPTGAAGGDLTGSYPNPTVAASAITNAKLANMANNTVKGNNTGGSAAPVDLTASQARTVLGLGTAAVLNVPAAGDAASGEVVKGDDTRLTAALSNPMTTLGDIIKGGASGSPSRLGIGSAGDVLRVESGIPAWGSDTRSIEVVIDGGGVAITTGTKLFIEVPFACTIERVTMLADVSGSIVVDIWKDTYAQYPPTVADTITASAKPTISAAQKSQDATLTGWTTAIAAGDILGFNVDSVTSITRLTLSLKVKRT
jgi:hypothetical protein